MGRVWVVSSVTLAMIAGFAVSSISSANSSSSDVLLLQVDGGDVVALCPPGGSHEFHSAGDENDRVFDSADEAAESLLTQIKTAASSRNPMLRFLEPAVRDEWERRFDLHYGPARSLAYSRSITIGEYVYFEMDYNPIRSCGHAQERKALAAINSQGRPSCRGLRLPAR
jgi:hypothetical protein